MKNGHVPDTTFTNQIYCNMHNNASTSEPTFASQDASAEVNAPITQDVTPSELQLFPVLSLRRTTPFATKVAVKERSS